METEPSTSAATDYSPAKPVPASIVCSSMADPAKWQGRKLMSLTLFETQGPRKPPFGHRPGSDDYATPNLGEDDLSAMLDKGHPFGPLHPASPGRGVVVGIPK